MKQLGIVTKTHVVIYIYHVSGHKTVHITEPLFHQIVKLERCGNCRSTNLTNKILYWYTLNVSTMLTDLAEDVSVAMCENAPQALA